MLNKNSPIPLYYQLAERIQARMQAGDLQAGDQLPSERELGAQMGVSRMTARQAVAYLVQQGALTVKPGVGTFVIEPKLAHDALHLLSFTEEMTHQGWDATSRVLAQTIVTPPLRVANALELAPDITVVKIVRLRLSQAVPLLLETVYVPTARCPGLERVDLTTQSLYALLEQGYGLRLERTRQTLEATVANAYEADLFGVPPGTGMILLEGVTCLAHDQPVEYFKAIYRGDRFKFKLESQRNTWAYEIPGAPRMSVVLR